MRAEVRLDAGGAALLGLGPLGLLLAISRESTWGWTSGRTLAIVAGADNAGDFPVDSAYTWVFRAAMGGARRL